MANEKINKEFCLTDDSVNVYGYRLLTSGLMLDRFRPAIGYLMHGRDKGVAVRWTDFRQEGDKLFAKPIVNGKLFPDLAEQINEGFYDAASCGHIVALELSDDPAMKMEGQTGPTVTKWFPREISIVDIPGNYNALAMLYDERDNVLHDLTDKTNIYNSKSFPMTEIKVTPEHIVLMDLKADATPEQFGAALADLAAKAKRTETAEKELADLKAETAKKEVSAILEKGKADRKITNELAAKLEKDYSENPQGLKDLVDKIQAQQLVTAGGENAAPTDLPEKFKGKTYQDLYLSGELGELKANYPDYFKTLKEK